MFRSKTEGVIRDRKTRIHCCRFSRIDLLSILTFLRLRDFDPKSSCTTRLSDLGRIAISRAILRVQRRGFRSILFFNCIFRCLVLTVPGWPFLGLSSKFSITLYLLIVRYTNGLRTFSHLAF